MVEGGLRGLTPQQFAIVKLVGQGLSNGEIARELFITENTVKAHLRLAMRATRTRTRAEIAVKMVRAGII